MHGGKRPFWNGVWTFTHAVWRQKLTYLAYTSIGKHQGLSALLKFSYLLINYFLHHVRVRPNYSMSPTLLQPKLGRRASAAVERTARRSRALAARVMATVVAPTAPGTAQADGIPPHSGLKHLPEAARARAQDRKANKFEKVKVEKCGSNAWTDVFELSQLLKEGNTKWEDLNLDDIDIRMKWAGLFHRGKRTPGKFMMRLKVSSTQHS